MRIRARLLCVGSLAALASSAATSARADASNFALDWTAPRECPSREQMEERIARLVGEGKHPRENVRASALLANDGGVPAFQAEVELQTSKQRTSRHVEGDSCAAVSDAIALIIALAIEPEAMAPPPVEPREEPPLEIPPAPDDVARRRPIFVSASARFDVGSLPAPAFGGELALGLNPRHVNLEIGGALLASARSTLPERPNEGADIRLTDLGGRGCYEIFDARLDVGPCAGLHARWMSAHGFGSTTPHDATGVFGVATLGAVGKMRLTSRLRLRFSVEAELPFSRPSFLIDTGGTVYRPAALAFRSAVGAELHF